MTRLFNRDLQLRAGTLTVDARTAAGERQPLLKVVFDIKKTADLEANTCNIEIWNLKESTRSRLQEKGIEVILEAGYLNDRNQIFKGDLETATITKERVDWVTALEFGDGSKQIKEARINESVRGPVSMGSLLQKAVDALGLDPGNIAEKVRTNGARSVLKELVSGFILSGKASDIVDEIASSMGLGVSVQDKTVQALEPTEVVRGDPVTLDESKGLIGSPQIGEEGVVTATSLLNGRIKPGVKVNLDSALLRGSYKAMVVRHQGDTWGEQWQTVVEMKAR